MKKAFLFLYNIEEYILQFLFVLMGISLLIQIVSRYVLNNPLLFTEELASLCFIWMTMIGAGFCIKNKLNTRIDLLVSLLPLFLKKMVSALSDLLCMSIFIYLVPVAIRFTRTQAKVTTPAMQLPMSVIYVSFIIATVLICIRFSVQIYETLTGKKLIEEGLE